MPAGMLYISSPAGPSCASAGNGIKQRRMVTEVLEVEISLVNTNNRALLNACLASLPEACAGLNWHVTVVDNESRDGSAEMVATEFPSARLIRNAKRLGFGANHNQ